MKKQRIWQKNSSVISPDLPILNQANRSSVQDQQSIDMWTKIAIYGFLYPLSLLPLSVLYAMGSVMRFFIYNILHYRLEVVRLNLQNSFPDKTQQERKTIERKYYRHLVNLFVEGIKLLTLSRKELMKRYRCVNPEVVNDCFRQGKSVILLSGHYNNWEWMVLSLSMQFLHHGIGVGKPNTNKIFERIINKARTRYGTEVVFADTVRDVFADYDQQHTLCSYMMLCDQSPASVEKSYITFFLHQPSAMIYGAEYFAKKYNYPVLYYVVRQARRGYYEIEVETISDTPQNASYGTVIESYVKLLQRDIETNPPFWLWSHKRWKFPVPPFERGLSER
ncbi:MAG: lysophospholipid acyltransferase family protein [Bacteroidales bacterium]|jgi:KDO2-lipid IV(A) lauroyltransferase|nr:lysophospholipid acyltransferase family protein [Bacteroidales bacterium]